MEVILGKHAGFCFGVKKAVDLAESLAGDEPVYTLGPIIHNSGVIKDLEDKGVFVKSLEELGKMDRSKVVIRSHGVSRAVEEALCAMGHEIIDATCPHVKRIHNLVNEYSKKGYFIIVIGDINHAEVEGIAGWIEIPADSTPENCFCVIGSTQEAQKFSLNTTKPVCLVSQTTFNINKLKECVEILEKKGYDVLALDTVCSATHMRQVETEQIAAKVDAMIVIGDRSSSNTRKLFDIAKGKCKTYFLQTKEDLDPDVLHSIGTVGITAGASTPDKLIREVMLECQK